MKLARDTQTTSLYFIVEIQENIIASMQNLHLLNINNDQFNEMDTLHSFMMEENIDEINKMLSQVDTSTFRLK